ncbi:MAG: hypothetical protein ACRBDL_04265 [Alphaproteobacteria bacterium]
MRSQNLLTKRIEASDLGNKVLEFDALCDRVIELSPDSDPDISGLSDALLQNAELLENLVEAADQVCEALFGQDQMSSDTLQNYFVDKMDDLQEKVRTNLEIYFYAHQIENVLSIVDECEVRTCH